MARGDVKPKLGLKPRDMPTDRRLTTCTDCKWGIFPEHKYQWTNRGLVHCSCEKKRLKNEVERIEAALQKG